MWVEELIKKSITLWAAVSSGNLFTQLCFPLSFELTSDRKSCWPPSSDENRIWDEMPFSYISSPEAEGHTKRRVGVM